jgi:hypothetical protein
VVTVGPARKPIKTSTAKVITKNAIISISNQSLNRTDYTGIGRNGKPLGNKTQGYQIRKY